MDIRVTKQLIVVNHCINYHHKALEKLDSTTTTSEEKVRWDFGRRFVEVAFKAAGIQDLINSRGGESPGNNSLDVPIILGVLLEEYERWQEKIKAYGDSNSQEVNDRMAMEVKLVEDACRVNGLDFGRLFYKYQVGKIRRSQAAGRTSWRSHHP